MAAVQSVAIHDAAYADVDAAHIFQLIKGFAHSKPLRRFLLGLLDAIGKSMPHADCARDIGRIRTCRSRRAGFQQLPPAHELQSK